LAGPQLINTLAKSIGTLGLEHEGGAGVAHGREARLGAVAVAHAVAVGGAGLGVERGGGRHGCSCAPDARCSYVDTAHAETDRQTHTRPLDLIGRARGGWLLPALLIHFSPGAGRAAGGCADRRAVNLPPARR